MRWIVASSLVLTSCGTPPGTTDAAQIDAATMRRSTLTVATFSAPGPGLRLVDGATLAEGEGDLWLAQRSTVALYAAAPAVTLCPLGTFASIELAPTDESACTSGLAQADNVVGGEDGVDRAVGRAWLVVAPEGRYVVRAVHDEVTRTLTTLVVDVLPVR
ncbi:MAG: hypothetical protein U0234_24815 [Sandaracinus sp.]